MDVVDIHKRIISLAEERGMSLYKLEKRAGLTGSSLYNMCDRKSLPRLDTLEKICDGLNVSLSEFFSFLSKPQPGEYMTEDDCLLIEANRALSGSNQKRLLAIAQGMMEAQKSDKE